MLAFMLSGHNSVRMTGQLSAQINRNTPRTTTTACPGFLLLQNGNLIAEVMDALDLADCREAQRRVALLALFGNGNPVACEMRQSK
jgi:hypothetical protein